MHVGLGSYQPSVYIEGNNRDHCIECVLHFCSSMRACVCKFRDKRLSTQKHNEIITNLTIEQNYLVFLMKFIAPNTGCLLALCLHALFH